jgi:hypothetical protein
MFFIFEKEAKKLNFDEPITFKKENFRGCGV